MSGGREDWRQPCGSPNSAQRQPHGGITTAPQRPQPQFNFEPLSYVTDGYFVAILD